MSLRDALLMPSARPALPPALPSPQRTIFWRQLMSKVSVYTCGNLRFVGLITLADSTHDVQGKQSTVRRSIVSEHQG